jgi:cystathionine gamma-synthase
VLVLPTYSYLGVRALVDDHVRQGHLQVRFVDIADTAAVVAAIPGADVVWVETPTNPTLDVADVPAICAAAAAAGAKVVVDNTFATPVCARPLADGATIVIHSGTKFIGGHSDLLIGLAVAADDATYARLRQTRLVNGSTPGALEAFLALRGVRTLPLRMERMQANAVEVVARLRTHTRSPRCATRASARWWRSCSPAAPRRPMPPAVRCGSSCRPPASAAWSPRWSAARSTPAMRTCRPASSA